MLGVVMVFELVIVGGMTPPEPVAAPEPGVALIPPTSLLSFWA